MKVNKYGIICALALLSGVVGCEDSSSLLDKEESNDIYENMVFSDPYNATWFLSNIYKSMNDGFMVFGSDDSGGFLGNAVDEGIWKANWDNAYKMSVGAWATTDMLLNYDPWKKYYTAIRAACRFLEHADEIPDSPEPFIDEGVRTRMKGEARFLRALFYLPQLLPVAVAAIIMGWIFRPEDGAVNALLAKIGLGALQHNWLGSPDSALPILMFILVWIQLGYPIVIFMSGLQRVDPELYEAAGLDGANWWQKFRVVTLPSIIPELLVVILTATIGALKTFAPVYLLTKGGPGTSTTVPSYYSYNQFFQVQQVGYGAAISTALTVVIIVFSIVFTLVQKHVEKELV